MSRMIYSRKLWFRGFKWRQLASQAETRERGFKNIWKWPFFWLFYRRKQTQSFVCPVLVIGQNPWLNVLLVWKLSFHHPVIWLLEAENLDRWNYNILNTNAFLSFLNKWFDGKNSIESYMDKIKASAMERSEVVLLPRNFFPKESVYDEQTRCWVLKLTKGVWPNMEKVETTRTVKQSLLKRPWKGSARAVWRGAEVLNQDDDFACHYVLAEQVHWTSVPPYSVGLEYKEDGETYTIKSTPEYIGVGSAKRIAKSAKAFMEQPFRETSEIVNEWKIDEN